MHNNSTHWYEWIKSEQTDAQLQYDQFYDPTDLSTSYFEAKVFMTNFMNDELLPLIEETDSKWRDELGKVKRDLRDAEDREATLFNEVTALNKERAELGERLGRQKRTIQALHAERDAENVKVYTDAMGTEHKIIGFQQHVDELRGYERFRGLNE